jgi:D-alanyl-D-alanine carboxypeptidase
MRASKAGQAAVALTTIALTAALATPAVHADGDATAADRALDRALVRLVALPEGPPGVIAIVQRGDHIDVHTAGVGDVATGRRPRPGDHMRIASTAKAFSGAVALSLVSRGVLSLDDTIAERLPYLPERWGEVTLRHLLNHTSGVPDFTGSDRFVQAFLASLDSAPPPRQLLSYIQDEDLVFPPGTRYEYSNSDNIVVGLMVEAATGKSYTDLLATLVYGPLGLRETSLPRGVHLPSPAIRGYDTDGTDGTGGYEDLTELVAAGWAWASGGIVSTPGDLNRFIRGYVGGALYRGAPRQAQFEFVPGGGSEPTGPGDNSAGLALFRYQTRCGTVFGHTGNTFGYTQFMAASRDGQRSVTVSMNLQRTQESTGTGLEVFRRLRQAEEAAVCAALA